MRRSNVIRWLFVAALAVMGAAVTSAAWAYWTATGTGAASATTGTLNPPTDVTVPTSVSGSTISVSWTAPVGGVMPTGYNVTRVRNSDSATFGACGTPATPVTTTSCDDLGVGSGTYHYFVTSLLDDAWTAVSADSGNVTVNSDSTPPTVSSINVTPPSLTNSGSVSWTVTFSENVTGVDATDFALANTGLSGTPAITGVTGSDASYTLTASTGSGSGSLGLNLVDNDSITDAGLNPLGGSGAVNGDFTGQVFTIDRTVPAVSSIVRQSPATTFTNASSVTFRVTFSEDVTGVTAADFFRTLTGTLSGTLTGTVTPVSASVYDVVVNTGAGDGTIRLDLVDDDSIADIATNKLGGTGTGNGDFFSGQVYSIDRTLPTASITGTPNNPTNSTSASFTFTTADPTVGGVSSGVNRAECQIDGGTYSTCTSPANYSSLGAGSHTFQVRAVDNVDNTGVSQSFTWLIDLTSPVVSSINRQTPAGAITNASSVTFRVTFSEAVTGVDATDFATNAGGTLSGTSVDTVTPISTSVYDVVVDTGSGDGVLRLDVDDDDSIADLATNTLNGGFTSGATYTVDRTNPTATITVTPNNPSNSTTANFTFTTADPTVGGVSSSVNRAECQIDNGGYSTCTSIKQYTGLSAGSHTFDLRSIDNATNTSSVDSFTWVIDVTAPTVTIVSSTLADGAYKAGQLVPVTVTFSEVVNVTGTPTLTLETGTTDRTVNFSSGSGTNTLTFNYTVQAGDTSSDLNYVNTSSLALPGGATIRDAATNNASTTLPALASANSLAGNKAIVIDTTAPTVTNVTSTLANGEYKAGQLVPVTVTFSEVVNVSGTPTLTLETGATDRVVDYTSGSGTNTLTFEYTVQAGDTSNDLNYVSTSSLALNGGTIRDPATNNATLTLPGLAASGSLATNKNIIIDTTAPTVTNVTSTLGNGSYKAGQLVPITITFSEGVGVTGTPQLILETSATDRTANYASGAGGTTLTFNYTVQAGDTSSDLDYVSTSSLILNGGAIWDPAQNDATLTLPAPGAAGSLGANKAIVIDTTAPTVTNVTSTLADGLYKAPTSVPVTVTFSEVVTVVNVPTLTLETGSVDRTVNYTSGSGTNTLTFTYVVQAGDASSDLNYVSTSSLALAGGTIRDAATNNADVTLPATNAANSLAGNKAIAIDAVQPTVTSVTSTAANGAYKAGDVVPVTIIFSELVNVTGTPTLTLETGTTDRIVNYSSGSGSNTLTFDYTVQAGDASSDLDYTLAGALSAGGTIQDPATNPAIRTLPAPGAAGSLGANKAIVIDTVAPTVTLTAPANNSFTTDTTPAFTGSCVTADGTVTIIVKEGTTTVQTPTFTCASNSFSVSATTLDDGTYTAQASQTDAAGNTGTSAIRTFTVDTTAPTVTSVSSTLANGSYTVGQVVPVTVTFSEVVNVVGVPTLTLETGATDRTATYASGSGSTTLTLNYTVQSGDISSDLDYTATNVLTAGTSIRDAALLDANRTLPAPGAAGSLGANKAIVIDGAAPTVMNVTSSLADGVYKLGQVVPIQVTFSESVNVTGTPRLEVETGVTDRVANFTSGSGTNTLTFTYTAQSGDASSDLSYTTTAALSLNSGTIKDDATNNATLTLPATGSANSLGGNKAIVIDTTAPTISAASLAATNTPGFVRQGGSYFVYANASDATSGLQTLTADVSNFTTGATSVALSSSGGPFTVGSNTFTYRSAVQTATNPLSAGLKSWTITATDIATNSNTLPATSTVDNTAPTLTSVTAANDGTVGKIDQQNSNRGDTLTFTYSDTNGIDPSSIVSGWDGTGTTSVTATFTNGASIDSITVPGIGTVTLGSGAWITSTQNATVTLTRSSTNVFVIEMDGSFPTSGFGTGVSQSNFTWSASGGTATDVAGNAATGSVTTNNQRF